MLSAAWPDLVDMLIMQGALTMAGGIDKGEWWLMVEHCFTQCLCDIYEVHSNIYASNVSIAEPIR